MKLTWRTAVCLRHIVVALLLVLFPCVHSFEDEEHESLLYPDELHALSASCSVESDDSFFISYDLWYLPHGTDEAHSSTPMVEQVCSFVALPWYFCGYSLIGTGLYSRTPAT
jgi:hypothetical protein